MRWKWFFILIPWLLSFHLQAQFKGQFTTVDGKTYSGDIAFLGERLLENYVGIDIENSIFSFLYSLRDIQRIDVTYSQKEIADHPADDYYIYPEKITLILNTGEVITGTTQYIYTVFLHVNKLEAHRYYIGYHFFTKLENEPIIDPAEVMITSLSVEYTPDVIESSIGWKVRTKREESFLLRQPHPQGNPIVKLKKIVDAEVIDETDEWFEVKLHYEGKRYEGWIKKEDVLVLDHGEEASDSPDNAETAETTPSS